MVGERGPCVRERKERVGLPGGVPRMGGLAVSEEGQRANESEERGKRGSAWCDRRVGPADRFEEGGRVRPELLTGGPERSG